MTKSKEYTIYHHEKELILLVSQGQHDNGIEIKIDDGERITTMYLPQSEAEELAELLQDHYGE